MTIFEEGESSARVRRMQWGAVGYFGGVHAFQLRLFLLLFAGFVAATVVGTLTHECGHWAVAEALGQEARIAYAYTDLQPYPHLLAVEALAITLGGPLQTMLTASLGLLLVRRRRKHLRGVPALRLRDWLYIFIALFWLRQTANAAVWLGVGLLTGRWGQRGDEIKLANALGLPAGTLLLFTAAIGAAVLAYITLCVVPRAQRPTFLMAGLSGGVAGYFFWLEWIGPIVLP